MITGTSEYLTKLAAENVCSEHGKPVTVAWIAATSSYCLRCGEGHLAKELTRIAGVKDLIKRGEMLPDEKMRAFRPREDLGSHHELSPEQTEMLIQYAQRYGLDPYRGHVMMMYGKPYIGLDGYIWYAHRRNIPFNHWPRPMNEEERKAYQVDKDDRAWLCTGVVNGIEMSAPGIGIVAANELIDHSKKDPEQLLYPVVSKHPQLIAQKRAEWQWFRRAFPIGEDEHHQALHADEEANLYGPLHEVDLKKAHELFE
jgi:hypothetical protein